MLPEEKIVSLLKTKGMKLATAESCTGGLLAKRITDIPGSSEVFDMGIVSYANRIKHRFLGVPDEVLNTVGAVSEQTAEAMARGVCAAAEADISAATTGIAGPGGGTATKPVGLVYISVYLKQKDICITKKLNLSGSREEIRNRTADIVFQTVIDNIE